MGHNFVDDFFIYLPILAMLPFSSCLVSSPDPTTIQWKFGFIDSELVGGCGELTNPKFHCLVDQLA